MAARAPRSCPTSRPPPRPASPPWKWKASSACSVRPACRRNCASASAPTSQRLPPIRRSAPVSLPPPRWPIRAAPASLPPPSRTSAPTSPTSPRRWASSRSSRPTLLAACVRARRPMLPGWENFHRDAFSGGQLCSRVEPRSAFGRRCHSVARLAGTINRALDDPRSLRRFNELADIGKPFGFSLRNDQRGKIGSKTILKHARAGEFGRVVDEGRTDRCERVHTPAPEQVECGIRRFDADLLSLLYDAAERQRRGVIAHHGDAYPWPIRICGASQRGARRHQIGVFDLHEGGCEAADLVRSGRVEAQRCHIALTGAEAFDGLAGVRHLCEYDR